MSVIIAENEWLFAVDKPAGLIAHSDGRTEEPSLAEWLIKRYPYLAEVGEPWVSPQGVAYPVAGMVHRLDRTTSGIMLVAKTQDVYKYLKGEFKARRVEKKYRALLYGHIPRDEGEIVAEIMRSSTAPKRWYARPCLESDPRAAITRWTMLARLTDPDSGEPASYIEASPKTGRTHQLRVHFAAVGNPIVADHLYAPERPALFGFTRPALHAYRISLYLPDGKAVSYVSPLPSDFPVN